MYSCRNPRPDALSAGSATLMPVGRVWRCVVVRARACERLQVETAADLSTRPSSNFALPCAHCYLSTTHRIPQHTRPHPTARPTARTARTRVPQTLPQPPRHQHKRRLGDRLQPGGLKVHEPLTAKVEPLPLGDRGGVAVERVAAWRGMGALGGVVLRGAWRGWSCVVFSLSQTPAVYDVMHKQPALPTSARARAARDCCIRTLLGVLQQLLGVLDVADQSTVVGRIQSGQLGHQPLLVCILDTWCGCGCLGGGCERNGVVIMRVCVGLCGSVCACVCLH